MSKNDQIDDGGPEQPHVTSVGVYAPHAPYETWRQTNAAGVTQWIILNPKGNGVFTFVKEEDAKRVEAQLIEAFAYGATWERAKKVRKNAARKSGVSP